jgi:hypothetical protein
MTTNERTRRPGQPRPYSLAVIVVAVLCAGCAEDAPLAPDGELVPVAHFGMLPDEISDPAITTLRRVTARYQRLQAAMDDGFVLLHPCEERPGEGPVGSVYVRFDWVMDGVIDPEKPDGLVYEPTRNGRERLVAVEFAVPYALWSDADPPQFLGASFQPEDEFGVWALHVWLWRHNPEGLFAESNPHVSCSA